MAEPVPESSTKAQSRKPDPFVQKSNPSMDPADLLGGLFISGNLQKPEKLRIIDPNIAVQPGALTVFPANCPPFSPSSQQLPKPRAQKEISKNLSQKHLIQRSCQPRAKTSRDTTGNGGGQDNVPTQKALFSAKQTGDCRRRKKKQQVDPLRLCLGRGKHLRQP